MAKCILAEAVEQAKSTSGSTQLCVGLEAGIKGYLHAVQKTKALAVVADKAFWVGDSSSWTKNVQNICR